MIKRSPDLGLFFLPVACYACCMKKKVVIEVCDDNKVVVHISGFDFLKDQTSLFTQKSFIKVVDELNHVVEFFKNAKKQIKP